MPPGIVLMSTNTDLVNFEMDYGSNSGQQSNYVILQEYYCRLIPFELGSKPSNLEFRLVMQGALVELASDLIKSGKTPC